MNTISTQDTGWTCLSIEGPDSRTFLQGQLSNDTELVSEQQAGFFALCTPKGRTISNFYLLPMVGDNSDSLIFLVPEDLADATINTLAKYIVFSKAELRRSDDWQVHCIADLDAPMIESLELSPPAPQALACIRSDKGVLMRFNEDSDFCALVVSKETVVDNALNANDWELADIRAGRGIVRGATSDQFVPQMLNMQLSNGISFTKGCYTGQEIVARSQYRGKLKRRMYRAAMQARQLPEIGSDITDNNGKSVGTLVCAAFVNEEQIELLAVLSLKEGQDVQLSLAAETIYLLDLPYSFESSD